MTAKDSEFKPAKVHAPEPRKKPDKGSGEYQEMDHDVISSRPQFTEKGLNDLKRMVQGANPEEVANVAKGWRDVRVALVGEGWDGGIKKHFDDAVTKVLQTWHGSSAEQFAVAAQKISDNFANLAPYPHNTGEVLQQISENLRQVQKCVEDVKEPSSWESKEDWLADKASSGVGKGAAVGNTIAPGVGGLVGGLVGGMVGGDGRDDSQLKVDLQNPKMSIWDAMNKNRHNLSLGKERQLEAAHYMEQLGTTYRAGVKALSPGRVDDGHIKAPDNGSDNGGSMIPPIGPYGPAPSAPKTGAPAPKMPSMKGGGYKSPQPIEAPRPHGIDGGVGSIPKTPGPSAPHVGTGLDGLSGGARLGTGGGGIGGGVGTGGLSGGPGIGGGPGVGGGSGSGIGSPGMPGMIGGAGGSGARAGGAGAGAGARGGRAGMPGMAGAAGAGKGAGAKGAGAAGKGGALARQKGGVIGGKVGKAGAGGQGGSGLHRSRGGTQQGAAGGRRPAGMAGAHGAHGAKGKDKAKENGQRPDYLVEDEETWTPERNVAPRVIE
ncbi:hypothetical protein [Streptomyces sp. N2A]|uniref:WXG100 family type VII secretion target n=1 Tax=Streptomyces sp. N2A TaxID=3073936 RepID=UPI0028704EB0|nr:hypothetical protein [Streptomyces sp. N2A]